MSMKGINLHLYPSNIKFESRMMRMTSSLASAEIFERIDLVGIWEPGLPEIQEIDQWRRIVRIKANTGLGGSGGINRLLQLMEWNFKIARYYRDEDIRVVNPHIVWALPVAAWFKKHTGAHLVYDTHELETETLNSQGLRQKLSQWIERSFIKTADAIHVVCHGIEKWYRNHYRLDNVLTVKNYPLRLVEFPVTEKFREKFKIPESHIIFCYQGLLGRGNDVEMLLQVFQDVGGDKHLVFLGFGPMVEHLERVTPTISNIHFHPGVPFDQVPLYTGSADVSLVIIEDSCLSYHHCLPNKLLESLNAGVPTIVNDLPEMVGEVQTFDSGWVVENGIGAITELVDGLDQEMIKKKKAGAKAWSQAKYWEIEAEKMLGTYQRVLDL